MVVGLRAVPWLCGGGECAFWGQGMCFCGVNVLWCVYVLGASLGSCMPGVLNSVWSIPGTVHAMPTSLPTRLPWPAPCPLPQELKRQSWRYHKHHNAWFQRYAEPQHTTEEFEQVGGQGAHGGEGNTPLEAFGALVSAAVSYPLISKHASLDTPHPPTRPQTRTHRTCFCTFRHYQSLIIAMSMFFTAGHVRVF